jgi:choline dehydrogenase
MIEYPAGRVTGGSSAINSAVALRGAPEDYDAWALLTGEARWSYAELLPYFRRIERDEDFPLSPLHGDGGPIPVRRCREDDFVHVHRALRDACLDAGFSAVSDHNDPAQSGVGPWPMNVRDGVRISTALGYLTPEVRARPNLEIRSRATARRVVLDDHRQVIGVEVLHAEQVGIVATRQATLAAGAIATPAILMRSGIGDADDLQSIGVSPLVDAPGVGRGLHDHPFTWLAVVPKPGVCDLPQRSVQVGLRYTTDGSSDRNDMQILAIVPVDISHAPDLVAQVGADRIFMIGAGLQCSHSRGTVSLDRPDPDAAPRIALNIGSDPRDTLRLREGLRLAWRLLHSGRFDAYFEHVALFDRRWLTDDELLDAYISDNVITFKHPTGTARMGSADDPNAVVDPRGRVHGASGLHVADASIMPAIPRANTNLTCIAIGERIADWLLETSADRH